MSDRFTSSRWSRRGWRALRRGFRPSAGDEIDDELRYHLDERTRDYLDRGLDPESARRAALQRLGDLEGVRAECADLLAQERRAHDHRVRLTVSWLDVKLGLRMLAKYPGLSFVSVLGMAVAIAIGVGSFAFVSVMLDPTLPLDEGARIVSLQNNRADTPGQARQALHDLIVWRDELRSVQDLGAFRSDRRNLVKSDGSTALVGVAEMSAAGFRVARVAPLLGRTLSEDDELFGAPDVVIVAAEEWRQRFDGDPDIVGSSVRLGEAMHTVVGVMPEGFRFPVNHRYWVPLRMNPNDHPVGAGPAINIFGRLADGATLRAAQAELTAIGQRRAIAFPDTHRHLRPRVLPYALPMVDVDSPSDQWTLRIIGVLISLLLVVVAVNVAVLVYARTATRAGEILVRNALGASRLRVVTQLFVEGLVLSLIACALALVIAALSMERVQSLIEAASSTMPFWIDLRLSGRVIAYSAGLAIVGGGIVGLIPALQATGKHVRAGLQQLAARGAQMRLGRVWSALIVVQVAVAVAVLPAAAFYTIEMVRYGTSDPGYDADAFIAAWLSMEREESPPEAVAEEYERAFNVRFADRSLELLRRLNQEPGIEAALASADPGSENAAWIEAEGLDRMGPAPATDGAPGASAAVHRVRVNHVGPRLFDMFDIPILDGRGFVDADMRAGATAVIVSRMFLDSVAGGANVIGRRVRYVDADGGAPGVPGTSPAADAGAAPSGGDAAAGPWFEIVGVVPDFPPETGPEAFRDVSPKIYHALEPGGLARLIARVRSGPAAEFLAPLRDITASVDPALQLHEMMTEGESVRLTQRGLRMIALGILLFAGSVLLLSAAGIYAMMSFTVARRRREIGIRSALGADARRILTGIFTRAAAQLGTGAAIGLVLAGVLDRATGGWVMGGEFGLFPIAAVIFVTVGLVAALGPARRGLAIQPTDALRADG